MYIIGWGSCVKIFEKDKEGYQRTVNMGYMDAVLPTDLFVHISKGHQVNIMRVKKYCNLVLKTKPNKILKIRLTMDDEKRLVVTEKHIENFMKLLPSNPCIKRQPDTCSFARWLNK
jgi:hypothetical protein